MRQWPKLWISPAKKPISSIMLCKKLSLQKLGFIVFQVLCSGTVCWFIKVNRLLNVEGAYNALKPKNLSHGRIRHSRVIRIWATFGFAGIFNICNHMSIASCKCCVNKSFTSSPHINSMFFVVFINFGDKPHISYPTAIIIDQSKTYRSHVSFAEPWVCVYVITFRRKQGGIKLMMFNVQKTKMCDIGTKPAAFGRVSNSCMYSRSRFYIRDLSIRASGIGEPTSESIQPCVKLILLSKVSLLPCRWHNKMNRSFVSNSQTSEPAGRQRFGFIWNHALSVAPRPWWDKTRWQKGLRVRISQKVYLEPKWLR